MRTRLASALAHAVLGPPGRQRVRASQSLLALVAYALFAVLLLGWVYLHLVDRRASLWLMATYLSGALAFYAVIRSGFNQRFTSDPSLTLAQTGFGMLISAGAYAISGAQRGAVMTFSVLMLVFAMFSLRPGQLRALAGFAFALLGTVMVWKGATDPARYPPIVEAAHLISTGVVLAFVSVLAGRMGTMRLRLKQQKLDLQLALARISELATRDELTGLINRRHMTALVQAEQARQRRAGSVMAIALIDIDLFKRINDSHGHRAGDSVLKTFADTAREALRTTDVLARWGGEEFLLMLPATSPEQALHSIERLREAVAGARFDAAAAGLNVTFSAGLSACEGEAPIEACIERADQAMYRAKTQGRNCTVLN